MRLRKLIHIYLLFPVFFLSCELDGTGTDKTSEIDIFRGEGKLTLYKTDIPYGAPDHIVFGDSIVLDASAFAPADENMEWEIYYSPNYEATAETFDNSWLSWHDGFVVNGEYGFFPEGSGSYLIKAIIPGSNTVLVDGILNVTRSPLDTGTAPEASLNIISTPENAGDQITLNANGSTDADSAELRYEWSVYKVNPFTYMYNRNEKSGGVHYQKEAMGTEWNHSFTESGLYYIRLRVMDPIYDLARDNESAIKYTTVYVRPAGETADTSFDPTQWIIDADETGEAIVSMGDFYWFEVMQNDADFTDTLILYKLAFYNISEGFYYKYYYATTFTEVPPEFTNWPAGAININLDRDSLRNATLGTLTAKEASEFASFSVKLYAFNPEGEHYSY